MPPRLHRPTLFAALAIKLGIHLSTNQRYGYFRDELYFLDCGRHLAFGYADHAPMIALIARAALVLGGSVRALRLFPALAGAVTVWLAILVARELGGRRFAQALAAAAVILAPAYLAFDYIMTMNAIEPIFWAASLLVIIRIIRTGDSRLWTWFGVWAGLGLETKHSTGIFGVALILALLLTPLRREFLKPWIWLGAAIALLIFAPNLIWQAHHGFPTLELLRNVQLEHKNVVLGPGAFFAQQISAMNPVLFLVWGAGLLWPMLRAYGPASRTTNPDSANWATDVRRSVAFITFTYIFLFALMVALKGKVYYLFPIYPALFAAGAVAWEQWTSSISATHSAPSAEPYCPSPTRFGRFIRIAIPLTAAIITIIFSPFVVPLLSPEQFAAYEHKLGFSPPKTEVHHTGPLPQIYGDQFGWPELVAEVAQYYHALPPEERAQTGIFANNYGEAGAIDMFGPRYGLPTAISGHQNHYFWGPPAVTPRNLIVLQDSVESLSKWCDQVVLLGNHYNQWGMAEENNPVLYCRGFKYDMREIWPKLKHWN